MRISSSEANQFLLDVRQTPGILLLLNLKYRFEFLIIKAANVKKV